MVVMKNVNYSADNNNIITRLQLCTAVVSVRLSIAAFYQDGLISNTSSSIILYHYVDPPCFFFFRFAATATEVKILTKRF